MLTCGELRVEQRKGTWKEKMWKGEQVGENGGGELAKRGLRIAHTLRQEWIRLCCSTWAKRLVNRTKTLALNC